MRHPDQRMPAVIAAQPNSVWQTAQPFEFGQTIYGSGDERPYAPAPAEDAYAALFRHYMQSNAAGQARKVLDTWLAAEPGPTP